MKSTPFQIIVISVFGVLIVITLIVLFLDKGSGNSKKAVELSLWGTVPSVNVQAVLTATDADAAGIKVTYKQIDSANFDEQLIESLASGTGPDAIIIPQDSIIRYQDKLYPIPYASLSQRGFMDTYVGEAELFLDTDGILGVPFSIDPLVAYWNRDMFGSAGISQPPQYWDEFLRLAESLTVRGSTNAISKSAVSIGEFSNVTNAKEILSAMALQAGVPITARSVSSGKLESAINLSANFQSVVNFYVEFANPVKSVYTWSRSLPNSQAMFTSGDLGVYFGFGSELPKIKAKNPNLDFDITYFPQARNTSSKTTFGRIYAVSAVKWSSKVSSAMQLALIFGSQAGVKAWSESSGLPPVRRDLLSVKPSNPYAVIYYDSALWSKGWLDPDSARTKKIFQDMVESITSGWMTTPQAVNQAAAQMGNLLGGR